MGNFPEDTEHTRLLSWWPYKGRFRKRMGRRQGLSPGEEEAGVGVMPHCWVGSRDSRGTGWDPVPQGELAKCYLQRPPLAHSLVVLPSLPLSSAQALACSQPAAMLTGQLSRVTLLLQERPFLILLPTFPDSWVQQA